MAYGDDEHKISFLFEPEHRGGHVYVTVRSGMRGMRAVCGTLTFRPEDWVILRGLLEGAVEYDHQPTLRYRRDDGSMVHADADPVEIYPVAGES